MKRLTLTSTAPSISLLFWSRWIVGVFPINLLLSFSLSLKLLTHSTSSTWGRGISILRLSTRSFSGIKLQVLHLFKFLRSHLIPRVFFAYWFIWYGQAIKYHLTQFGFDCLIYAYDNFDLENTLIDRMINLVLG